MRSVLCLLLGAPRPSVSVRTVVKRTGFALFQFFANSTSSQFTVAHEYRSAVPRRSRRPDRPAIPPGATGWQTAQASADGDFLVRTVPGAASAKSYRCPGCQQLIASGTAHLVVWPTW